MISCQNKKNYDGEYFMADSNMKLKLLVNIKPPVFENSNFDYTTNENSSEIHIYVGKLKNPELSKNNSFSKNKYYLQLNDKIAKLEDVKSFVYCIHCEMGEQIILINSDKNTPKDFLLKIESEILKVGIKKNQIYYLTFNNRNNNYGYNHGY